MTERRWVHCPCGKRLVKLQSGTVSVAMVCPRCLAYCYIRRKGDGTLTVTTDDNKLVLIEEAG